jgi:Smg protein
MFDVLVYLFENCAAFRACRDAESITRQLAEAGFDDDEITDAIDWLRDLDQVAASNIALRPPTAGAFRVYAGFEIGRLTPPGIAFLTFLESEGQLTPTQREIVIERALAVREAPVALAKLKVIVLMVLWSQQVDIDALMLEELLDDGTERDLN